MSENYFVIGIDYGTDSVRSLLINAQTGTEVKTSVFYYPRWKEGKYCNPVENQFRHHPLDYLEGLEVVLLECLSELSEDERLQVKGIAVDTTGSTPAPVNEQGEILSFYPILRKIRMGCLFYGKIIQA